MAETAHIIDPSELKGRKLGRVLTKMGKVTREQVHEAIEARANDSNKLRKKLGEMLLDAGLITPHDLAVALAGQRGFNYMSIVALKIPGEVFRTISSETANVMKVVPIAVDQDLKTATVAIASATNFQAVDNLKMNVMAGYAVTVVIAPAAEIDEVIKREYSRKVDTGELFSEVNRSEAVKNLQGRGDSVDTGSLESAASDNAVVRLVNNMLMQAIANRASDIHLEPFEDEFKMRYRIDGILYDMKNPEKSIAMAVISRIKIMAKLNIAERRLPQDGRINYEGVTAEPIDLRVAVLPTMFGESVVLRVLDRSAVQLDLDRIGLREDELKTMRLIIGKPNGIVLVTGPTGSGKTTTLYSALNDLNRPDKKIITAEDPVEFSFKGINQVQVREQIGLTFPIILRSMLRQAPNVILVGEIRDREVADIAIQAALTGHLVFSTLHTNDAPSAITRLVDMGVKPFLVASSIQAVLAQRLARILCSECKVRDENPDINWLRMAGITAEEASRATLMKPVGCEKCSHTGYHGRRGVYEMMVMNSEIRDLAFQRATVAKIRGAAVRAGMRTLLGDGKIKVLNGMTTADEVAKFAQSDLSS